MASSLLALLDDITSLLDDVSALTKVAATKTSGIMGDDLALNAQQVAGFAAERELPVVWGVAKGSLVNKVILVPAALALSAFLPAAIQPVLMIGGLFLCFEGVEKLVHTKTHPNADEATAGVTSQPEPAPVIDLAAFERDRIRGAIRTDFVLSAEIVVIALGTLEGRTFSEQATVLSIIGVAATAFVYGIVAGIVKLDDLGLRLVQSGGRTAELMGRLILRAAPLMMRALSILGTAAMFTVGGGILLHGVHPAADAVEHLVERVRGISTVLGSASGLVLEGLFGMLAGAVCVALVTLGQKMFRRRATPA